MAEETDQNRNADDPLIELGETKADDGTVTKVTAARSKLAALHAKADSLDKDYTTKTQQLAKDKDALDKQFQAVKSLASFGKLLKDDPEEGERQMRRMVDEAKGGTRKRGKGDDDDGDDKPDRRTSGADDDLRQEIYDLRLAQVLEVLAKDPDFAEHEQEVLKYATDNEIGDPKLAWKAWKGEHFDELHNKRIKDAANKKAKDDEPILKGGGERPPNGWRFDLSKSASENLIAMRKANK